MRKFKINVNGTAYNVEVEEIGGGAPVAAAPVAVAAPVAAAPVAAAAAPSNVSGTNIEAPMPGTIISVNVSVGDTVKNGDVVCILEAMKMENEIVSLGDGKVVAVNVSKGQNVNTGDAIVVIG